MLAIDNIFAFAVLVKQLPLAQQQQTKNIALSLAFVLRIILLFLLVFLKNSSMMITLYNYNISINQVFFIAGGLFLIFKTIKELKTFTRPSIPRVAQSQTSVISQIIFLDFIFSFDSVLTAIALTNVLTVIILSIVLSMVFMFYLADLVMKILDHSWRFHVLGLLFVGIVGLFLLAKGLSFDVDPHILLLIIIFTCLYEALVSYVSRLRQSE
jgi:predicted tellurium resistance membrane protein TerC